jgi:hypothetical protein
MSSFIFRVCAYHGEPVSMNGNGVHARSGLSIETPVAGNIINDPANSVVHLADGSESGYDLDSLIDDFEDEYGCKVTFDENGKVVDGLKVYEFDVFEPSWDDDDEAKDVIDDLTERLTDWAEGYPTGR